MLDPAVRIAGAAVSQSLPESLHQQVNRFKQVSLVQLEDSNNIQEPLFWELASKSTTQWEEGPIIGVRQLLVAPHARRSLRFSNGQPSQRKQVPPSRRGGLALRLPATAPSKIILVLHKRQVLWYITIMTQVFEDF